MNQAAAAPPLIWTVIETGDRWFQAVLRFTAGAVPHNRESVRQLTLAEAGQIVLQIEPRDDCRHVVLWEIPRAPAAWIEFVDVIAGVRRHVPQAVQLAHLPASSSDLAALAVQQAGVTVLLRELWSLEPLARRLCMRTA